MEPRPRIRFPIMVLGMLALLAALWAGLVRLGWGVPALQPALPGAHGPLMLSGFLGTLIALERAVALGYRWTYAAPLLTGLGALALIIGLPVPLGALLMTLGSLGLVAIFTLIVQRRPALFTATMGLGTLAWFAGNGLWLAGLPIYRVVPWWAGFLVLTIVGERLELSRMLRLSRTVYTAFLIATGIFLAGLGVSLLTPGIGIRLAGAGMVVLMLWLLRHDIARRTVRQTGLTRFVAICLLVGYIWLGISGGLALVFGDVAGGPHYDAMWHALFLGFVFSMIFGHAPIIFPAVLGLQMLFRPTFYIHLIVLHLSLLLRVAGDLAGWLPARQWGGLLNVVALLLFLASMAHAIRSASVAAQQDPNIPMPSSSTGA